MTHSPGLTPETKRALYRHLIKRYPRLTVKILLGLSPDGLDRMTILLGRGSDYDYRLLRDQRFREQELETYLAELQASLD